VRFWSLPGTGVAPGHPRHEAEETPVTTEEPQGDARTASAQRLARRGAGNPALDRLAELAARLLRTASAQVSVVADVQNVVGGAGVASHVVGSEGAVADSLCRVTVAGEGPLVVSDASADQRVLGLPPVASGAVGAYLGVPLVAGDGHTIGALCVFDPVPRSWSESDVALLEELAAPVVAELELAALSAEYEAGRVVWQLALDAAGIGAFDWNLSTGELRWDDRLLELFGLERDDFGGTIEAFNNALHPADLPRVTQALEGAIATCGDYAAEFRVALSGGQVRWVAARGRALCGADGTAVRLLGAAYDSTAVQEGEARVARVLEAIPTPFFHLDTAWRFTYVNAGAERLLGSGRDQLVGEVIWDLFPASVGSDFESCYRRAVATGQPESFDAYYPPPLDAWYDVRAWPTPDGLSVYFIDVTARHAAQEQVERAARRSALLGAVTAELTGTLDAEEAVGRLAPLVVPDLADWCVVTRVDDETQGDWHRRLVDVGWWHADPELRPVVDRYARVRLAALTDESFVARALGSTAPVVVASDAAAAVTAVLAPGEAQDLCRVLDPASAVVVQLRGRDQTVGLLSVFRGPDRETFSREDLETLVDVASRAGLALDNARLFAQQRDLAEGLQRSLLTAPPEPGHLEITVRYEPAAQAAQVGGDWYDSFLQSAGQTAVVIGDVVGHDTAAAAAMGQVRSLLRGIAVHSGEGPAAVLRGVDRVMETLQVDTTATAVIARLEHTPEESGRGTTRFRWSNAGHPPPMVINPDGTVTALAPADPDLLLGLDPTTARTESVVTLERGATVMLYTDGLVERRSQPLDAGLTRLAQVLTELAACDLTLDETCDRLLRRMLPERRDDDVALVAVRLTHE
jgi:serine phosphatase RsbU (regulator of sigma subunit)/PAS domain-containing protein